MRRVRVLIVAGEASSDAHGAGLLRALRGRGLAVEAYGIGGEALAEAGMELLASYRDLAVVGLFEVFARLPRILGLLRRIRREFAHRPPDLFLPIDAPDFNLRLLAGAARRGVPVVYFIAPQLWAWRSGRVRTLQAHLRELLVLFPFEEAWFRERGVPVHYVGHPLVDAIRERSAAAASCAGAGRIVAEPPAGVPAEVSAGLFLPGSRAGEVGRHMPILAAAAERLRPHHPRLRWTIRRAPALPARFYAPWLRDDWIRLSDAPIFELAGAAGITVAASGTASFEAALTGTPLIVVYRVHPLTWVLARRLVRVPWVAMANLASGRGIVPELLQGACSPEGVAAEIERLLGDPAGRGAMRRALHGLRERFGPPGAYARAAERVAVHLGAGGEERGGCAAPLSGDGRDD
ncbi:MAG: lipid-A-disaccharide synthase [Candidatus Eisenbacteria sp.]|nr:lipid-A-disaccharide synthase [Candidatus Eisenbacteria bacterium]